VRRAASHQALLVTAALVLASKQDVEAEQPLSSPLGRIRISRGAIAHIVGHTAAESYGVVGMSSRGRVGRLLRRGLPGRGIDVGHAEDGVAIDLYVIVEYGLNLAEVASTIRNRVTYEVSRLTGLPVGRVEVHIQAVRRSD
jgi:uncharacterized alkaline shock family protein YloU